MSPMMQGLIGLLIIILFAGGVLSIFKGLAKLRRKQYLKKQEQAKQSEKS